MLKLNDQEQESDASRIRNVSISGFLLSQE
jgi:hypothetical protein